ncbi:MAG: hypothetical protein K5871_07920 [Lachnospiraceae bacterium]|nr:hypothetical protein [Lachnospiraceae bacterium]
MGYNLFKIVPVNKNANKKMNEFLSSLQAAVSKGENITFADNDIRYTLKLQHDRIREKGLDMDYQVYSRDDGRSDFIEGSRWNDQHYENVVAFRSCGVKRFVTKDGMKLFKDDRKSVLYETVTDVLTDSHPDNDTFSCPNCGGVSTIAGLQDGCPYCGTTYKMDDLFPKVTAYFFLDDAGLTTDEFKQGVITSVSICAAVIFILNLIINYDQLAYGIWMIIAFILGSAFAGLVLGYILFAYFLIGRLIFRGIQSRGKMGTAGSRRKFENRMRCFYPEFSFEYFTSKAISLIKTAIYSPNANDLLFYKGDALDPKMKDIIDLNYGGALGLERFSEENGIVTVVTTAFFDVLYATEEKVKMKHEMFTAVFQRRVDMPVNFNFSMTRISCPTCGLSYDATRNKFCPGCGHEYEIISDDWALVSLKYR